MKINKISILLVFFIASMLTSCDEELTQLPNDSFTPETFYQNFTDFENAQRGMYSGLLSGALYGGSMIGRPDIMSDNLVLAQIGRRSNQFFYEWRYVANSTWNAMNASYIIINRANRIIESIDNLPDGQEKNNFLGEARAMRASALFDMLRIYSKIPTQETGDVLSSLGIPVVESTDPNYQDLRPDLETSYNYVVNELEEAKLLMNDNNGPTNFDKQTASALLSRVYLYLGNYPKVIDSANDVTQDVATRGNFSDIWTDSSVDGVLLKVDQDRNLDGIAIGVAYSQSSDSGLIPEYAVSFEFAEKFQSNDIRSSAYISVLPDNAGDLYNAVFKYFGEPGQNNGIVDPKLLRVAEVILNKAEAEYRSTTGDPLATLDRLRSERYASFTSPGETGQDLLDQILLERRLELAFEGHRFFDIKRLGQSVERSATEGEFFDGSGTPTNFTNLSSGAREFQLPIPQAEINIFPEFQQNPGY